MSEDIKKLMNAFGYLPQEVNQGITHEQWRREQRYRFAGLAMQAILGSAFSNKDVTLRDDVVAAAKKAVRWGDQLLAELEKPAAKESE